MVKTFLKFGSYSSQSLMATGDIDVNKIIISDPSPYDKNYATFFIWMQG